MPPPEEDRSVALTEAQRQRIFGRLNSPAPSAASPSAKQTDKDLEDLIDSFGGSSTTHSTPHNQPTTTTTEPKPHPRVLPDGTLSIHPSHLYPRTMSCREAFDQAFYCQSAGGKFNDIYRYGHIQSCSEQWSAFWFCMRIRTLPMANKEEVIAKHYEEREQRRARLFGSSEDVWDLRDKAVMRAFWRDPMAEEDG